MASDKSIAVKESLQQRIRSVSTLLRYVEPHSNALMSPLLLSALPFVIMISHLLLHPFLLTGGFKIRT